MTTFGQFFDLVASRPEARGSKRYDLKHGWLRNKTAEEWEALRDSPLSLELFNALAKWQRESLSYAAAFVPSDSAYEEISDNTMRFIGVITEVARECGLEPDIDWLTVQIPNPPALVKMADDFREAGKPFSCTVYRIAKAVAPESFDLFVEFWKTPTQQVDGGAKPSGEVVGVIGGNSRREVRAKLLSFRKDHNVVVTMSWPRAATIAQGLVQTA